MENARREDNWRSIGDIVFDVLVRLAGVCEGLIGMKFDWFELGVV